MDILSLPDVFLRELMKMVELQDRMRLRLTCRAFEKLVAETNAGHFEFAGIFLGKDTCEINIGDLMPPEFEASESELEKTLLLRHRLFRGMSLAVLWIKPDEYSSYREFMTSFAQNITIKQLSFDVQSPLHLENALQLIADFPPCNYAMDINFFPGMNNMLLFPPMKNLYISPELFFKMIATHENIQLAYGYLTLTFDEWIRAVQEISADCTYRRVRWCLDESTIIGYLNSCGISEASKEGDLCGKFEVLCDVPQRKHGDSHLRIRYEKCTIAMNSFGWSDFSDGFHGASVTITNRWT